MPAAAQASIAQRFMQEVGLTGFDRHFSKQLSGGMQQCVALARARPRPEDPAARELFDALDNHTRAPMQELLL